MTTRWTRLIRTFLKASFLLFTCLIAYRAAFCDPQPPLKVGMLLSLSGGLEQWCTYMRQGAEIAISEEDSSLMQLVFEDDRSVDRRATLSAVNKLRPPGNPRPWGFPGSLQASSRANQRAITRRSRHLRACGRHPGDPDPSDSTS